MPPNEMALSRRRWAWAAALLLPTEMRAFTNNGDLLESGLLLLKLMEDLIFLSEIKTFFVNKFFVDKFIMV
jgi:hypothetical protein